MGSMTDIFHPGFPDEAILELFGVMAATPQHTYYLLTKRPARAVRMLTHNAVADRLPAMPHRRRIPEEVFTSTGIVWPLTNVYLGTTVGHPDSVFRARQLLNVPSALPWISAEPLLGSIAGLLPAAGIRYVVVGSESGPGSRPMNPAWAREILAWARACGARFHMKQMTRPDSTRAYHNLDQFPEDLRIREFPDPR
jgi:protein gp37